MARRTSLLEGNGSNINGPWGPSCTGVHGSHQGREGDENGRVAHTAGRGVATTYAELGGLSCGAVTYRRRGGGEREAE
jgi:hypothetical protein